MAIHYVCDHCGGPIEKGELQLRSLWKGHEYQILELELCPRCVVQLEAIITAFSPQVEIYRGRELPRYMDGNV